MCSISSRLSSPLRRARLSGRTGRVSPRDKDGQDYTTAGDGALLGTSSGGPTYTGVVPTTRRIRGLRFDQAQTIVQITPAWNRGGTSDSIGQSKTSLISARNLLRDLAARGHRIRQIRRVK